jgi:hypothetical protein
MNRKTVGQRASDFAAKLLAPRHGRPASELRRIGHLVAKAYEAGFKASQRRAS